MHKFGPNNNDNRGGRQLGGGVGIKFRGGGARPVAIMPLVIEI